MRKVKEVLRLRFELGFGQRQIARSCGTGLSTVHEYLERAEAAGPIRGWRRSVQFVHGHYASVRPKSMPVAGKDKASPIEPDEETKRARALLREMFGNDYPLHGQSV